MITDPQRHVTVTSLRSDSKNREWCPQLLCWSLLVPALSHASCFWGPAVAPGEAVAEREREAPAVPEAVSRCKG